MEFAKRTVTLGAGSFKWSETRTSRVSFPHVNPQPFQGAHIEPAVVWYLIVGALLISMGLMQSVLQRLPLSPAMFYLPVGYMLGPSGAGLVEVRLPEDAHILALAAEIALLISLFTVGLKLRVPLSDRLWWWPVRLGFCAMLLTVGALTAIGVWLLHLPPGAALLLAAILAPTDPVLASDVQVKDAGDRDRIRFSLSGEGGLNDGTTFPFVMLALAMLAVPEAARFGEWTGLALAAWGVAAGLATGAFMGWAVGRLVVFLRRWHKSAFGMEEFLTLGLIALSYGAAHLVGGIGFLAVFATGVAVRSIEYKQSGAEEPHKVLGAIPAGEEDRIAADPQKGAAYMTEMVLGFNQQLEHIAEFGVVLLLGVIASSYGFSTEGLLVAALLFLLVRPLAVSLSMLGTGRTSMQNGLMAWFGIRGIGSIYYLMFALQYHWMPEMTGRFVSVILTVVAISVVLHGISATPLMERYYRRADRARSGAGAYSNADSSAD